MYEGRGYPHHLLFAFTSSYEAVDVVLFTSAALEDVGGLLGNLPTKCSLIMSRSQRQLARRALEEFSVWQDDVADEGEVPYRGLVDDVLHSGSMRSVEAGEELVLSFPGIGGFRNQPFVCWKWAQCGN